ncbi:leucine rich adaptor protein 1-like [Ictalurus punctatus]|uniref:Leucine rich adaptor protein 1-like n=1 Tax=Ictalurus punctatus TaxID=7998 RepID=A0A2D0QEX1_ICTPU|nr:leucine rich adaptor protein 1-like [Ictalurus punctatus]
MEEDSTVPDFRDIEVKLGRKVPESLARSITHRAKPVESNRAQNHCTSSELKQLESKMLFLKQEMAHLRALDVKLMQQLLSINEGIESIRWVMEERGGVASRESSLNGSLYSLSDSQDASHHGSFSSLQDRTDELDGISVGSYLDTLGEDLEYSSPTDQSDSFNDQSIIGDETFSKSPLRPRVDSDEYYCFG